MDSSPDFLIYLAYPIKEIDRCWEAEWRPPWVLCYAVARLADKRASNLTVLLTRPQPLLAFRGARGGNRGHPFVCSDQKAGGGGAIVRGIQMTAMFSNLPLVWWLSGWSCLFLLKHVDMLHLNLTGYKSQLSGCQRFDASVQKNDDL